MKRILLIIFFWGCSVTFHQEVDVKIEKAKKNVSNNNKADTARDTVVERRIPKP